MKHSLLLSVAALLFFANSNAQELNDFKKENKTAVFTTKFVTEDQKTVTYVIRDAGDGVWQFFSDDKYKDFDKVVKIVGLGHMITNDETLTQLKDLPIGYYATRKNKLDKWKIHKSDSEISY